MGVAFQRKAGMMDPRLRLSLTLRHGLRNGFFTMSRFGIIKLYCETYENKSMLLFPSYLSSSLLCILGSSFFIVSFLAF